MVAASLGWIGSGERVLGKARLGRGHVAPLLDDGLLHLPGVRSGAGADLLGDVHALLGGLQQGNELGHVLAGTLGLQVTSFLRNLSTAR